MAERGSSALSIFLQFPFSFIHISFFFISTLYPALKVQKPTAKAWLRAAETSVAPVRECIRASERTDVCEPYMKRSIDVFDAPLQHHHPPVAFYTRVDSYAAGLSRLEL